MAANPEIRVEGSYLLEKFPGKGGWTYAAIPELRQDSTQPFGWLTVSGSIDGFELDQYKLMPMGEGRLFLPVKSAIRKKIRKEAGDYVHVILYPDDRPVELSPEIKTCFEYEQPALRQTFDGYSSSEQKAFLDWIYEAKTDQTRADRILLMMKKLELGLKKHDRLPD